MKYLVPVMLLIIIVLVAVLAFSAGKSGFSVTKLQTPTPTDSSQLSTSETPTPTQENTRKVTGGGILSFPKYEITVPASWQDSKESGGMDDEKITLTKGSIKLQLTRAGLGERVGYFR